MALALLVLLLEILQDVPGVRLVGDDADLTLTRCLLDEAPGGRIQLVVSSCCQFTTSSGLATRCSRATVTTTRLRVR
jgi:hypothetical protein